MVGWHHQLDGHRLEQTLGVDDGQGSLACCSPWGRKESDVTEQLTTIVPNTYKNLTKHAYAPMVLFINVFSVTF